MAKKKLDSVDLYIKNGTTADDQGVTAGPPATPSTFEGGMKWADKSLAVFRDNAKKTMGWATAITKLRRDNFFSGDIDRKLQFLERFLEDKSREGHRANNLLDSALDVLDEKRGLHGWRLWLAIGGALSAGVAFDGCVEAASDKTVAEWAYETATEDAPSE